MNPEDFRERDRGNDDGDMPRSAERAKIVKSAVRKILDLNKILELNDPERKNEKAINNDDIANAKLDLYLFGKGVDINV